MISTFRKTASVRLCAALACTLVLATPGLAQDAPTKVIIDDVIPSGNLAVPTLRIVNLLKCKANGEFKQETLNEDIRGLASSKLFMDVRVEKQNLPNNRLRLFFLLREYPSIIQEVIYQGNKHLKPDDLQTITGLRKGAPLNPIAVQMGRQAILRRYNEMGRMLAEVDILEGQKPGDRRVVYCITEGQIAKVSRTLFEGNTFVTDERLRSQIEMSRAILDLRGNYDTEKVEQDTHHLEEYYKNFGYLDVRVRRELIWSDDHCRVSILFHIDEGIRYHVASVHTNGNKVLSADKLEADCKLKPGEYYNKTKSVTEQELMRSRCYPFEVNPTVHEQDYFTAPGEVAVSYIFQEMRPATVGQVTISDNQTTRDEIIRRQIGCYPAGTLTYPDLRVKSSPVGFAIP